MKKFISVIVLIFAASAVSNVSAQQTINSDEVAAFNAVEVSGDITVNLVPAEANAIDVILNDSDINKFKWGVKDGVLTISLRPTIGKKASAVVDVSYSGVLSEVSVSGGKLSIGGLLEADRFRISLSGGANATAVVDALDMELEVTGNSAALISGKAEYLSVRATERSKVDTRKMESVSVEVEAATGAEAYVNAVFRLVANAKTAATIFYTGSPRITKDRSSKFNEGLGSSVLNIGR